MIAEERPSLAELGEPLPPLRHGSEQACHEGDCLACAVEQAAAEAAEK